MHIVMVAAENDALPNCKVGGVADVIRDVPYALTELGHQVSVIVPDYGQHQLQRHFVADIAVPFRQHLETATLWRVEVADNRVAQYVISHSLFSEHGGEIYCNDTGERPFATDASKFAFFSAAVCEALEHDFVAAVDLLHLHDWHAATVAVLARFSGRFSKINHFRTIYTVHNLALQGVRPFKGDDSSLEAWFPTLSYDGQRICDHGYPHCYNPMRAGIVLADKVHVVSPTYAREVLRPSVPEFGFFGGERLELDMIDAERHGRLIGVLNGCNYPDSAPEAANWTRFFNDAEAQLFNWMAKFGELKTAYYLAHQRILQWRQQAIAGPVVTMVGRLTDQKALLLRQPFERHLVLDAIAKRVAAAKGRVVILGSGDGYLEYLFTQVMARNPNVLFLNGYGHGIGEALYDLGDLFLMPSSFEPCGISQMLAMRAGQPCLVHQVGGLNDTVQHGVTGFTFSGENLTEQVSELISCCDEALNMLQHAPETYHNICAQAKGQRFSWQSVAEQYVDRLYR
ncbi:glycogen synthase [Pseudoalteromonas fenneropenaei]|uniref:starch synthase n=1 Tax=Pseudoalteromonas fenneropenaei TaxID=1737459 RepID=A0ABV7CMM4_9GAMM